MKRILSLSLALLLLFAVGCQKKAAPEPKATAAPAREPVTLAAAERFAGGTGSLEDPYIIETAAQLARLSGLCREEVYRSLPFQEASGYLKGAYRLAADIDLNDPSQIDNWVKDPPQWEWRPIGESRAFCGTFDGDGHTVRGLYIHSTAEGSGPTVYGSYPGLFGQLNEATVKNLRLADSLIVTEGKQVQVGGIAASAVASDILGCESSATILVRARAYVGGVVGWSQSGGSLLEDTFTGRLEVAGGVTAGGIGGHVANLSSILNCANDGKLLLMDGADTEAVVGGLFGTMSPGEDTRMEGCRNACDLAAGQVGVGGLIGRVTLSNVITDQEKRAPRLTMTDCENTGNLSSNSATAHVAGITMELFCLSAVLQPEAGPNITLENCRNRGELKAAYGAAGLVGEATCAGSWKLVGCQNFGKITGLNRAAGIVEQVVPSLVSSAIVNCENAGEIRSETGAAGGIVNQFFGFTLYGDQSPKAPLVIQGCVNRGLVAAGGTITGVGGIVGNCSSNASPLLVEGCLNEGELRGTGAIRMGGILGSSALGSAQGYADALFEIKGCVNRGALVLGEGQAAFTADLDPKTELTQEQKTAYTEEHETGETAILLLGGSALGGLVGYCKQGIVTDSVNEGALLLSQDTRVVFSHADLIGLTVDETAESFLFCGGLAGVLLSGKQRQHPGKHVGEPLRLWGRHAPGGLCAPLKHRFGKQPDASRRCPSRRGGKGIGMKRR